MNAPTTGLLNPHHSKLDLFYRLSDIAMIGLVLFVAARSYGIDWNEQYWVMLSLLVTLFSITAETQGLYRSFRGAALRQIVAPMLTSWGIAVFGFLGMAYALKVTGDFSRLTVGTTVLVTPIVLTFWRILVRGVLSMFRRRGFNTRSVAIVGAEQIGVHLAKTIEAAPSYGFRLIGFFDDRIAGDRIPDSIPQQQRKGNFEDVVWRAKRGEVDLVYIALSLKGQDRAIELIHKLADTSVSVHLVPNLFVFDLLHSRVIDVGGISTISVYESPYFGVNGWVKRIEDVVLASLILILISVPMLAIAVGVKLSSPGPIIFKQRRYGIDGRQIKVWKFRSMTTCDDGQKVVQASKDDKRITRFGAFLRRTSLDELPQFINVLQGTMSIVGPRPHAVAHNEEYRRIIDRYMLRHKVKPGITGWAQVNGWRGETETLEKMQIRIEHDIHYIRSWSLWNDLLILVKTVFVGFAGRNAY